MNFKKNTLKNGVRVVTVPNEDTAAVTVLSLYGVGSRHENLKQNGASHFIEHMMFKGTRKRPTTLDISRDLDSVGADYNAFTAKDYTGYYVKLQADRLGLAVDMLEDMVYHSTCTAENVESERQVILEELRMYEDNPIMFVEELIEEELYRGSPLGYRIGGTVKSVNGITRKALIEYRDRHYRPETTVLGVAGRFDEAELMRLLERKFGRRTSAGRTPGFRRCAGMSSYRAPRVRIERRETEQVQLAVAFPAYGHLDRRLPALKMLSTILGGTMSSRLFMSVREREGLCYFIRSSVSPYQDIGDITVQAGLSRDRLDRALVLIFRELKRMRSGLVTAEELSRAKEYIKGKTALALEESSRQADWFAKQELLLGRMQTPEQRLKRIFAVTREDVRRVARDVFRANRCSVAAIGPFDDERTFRHAVEKL